jgi:hypothetical protein
MASLDRRRLLFLGLVVGWATSAKCAFDDFQFLFDLLEALFASGLWRIV